jgi:phosphocarrier protein NPr/phosphocarrier protein
VIGSKYGLHSRPATKIVNLAKQFQSELYLYRKDEKDKYADCKSLLSLLMLGASQGTELVLSGKGKDAQNAIE